MRGRGGWRMVVLTATLVALGATHEFDLPAFIQDQQRFQEQLTDSRWTANPMPYVDGLSSAVLKYPYTVLCDPEHTLLPYLAKAVTPCIAGALRPG